MPIWLPLGVKILAKKTIGMNEKLKNLKIFYVVRSPPLININKNFFLIFFNYWKMLLNKKLDLPTKKY